MTEYLSHKLLALLSRKLQIDDTEFDLYELGIEVIVSTILTSVFILLIGSALNHPIEAFLFLACFITLRNYSGGYHAKTRIGCFAVSIVSYIFSERIAYLFGKIPGHRQFIILAVGYLAVVTIFYLIAPLENPNKHLMPEWRRHNRVMAFIILGIWIGSGILCTWIGAVSIGCQICATLVVISFLLWIARR